MFGRHVISCCFLIVLCCRLPAKPVLRSNSTAQEKRTTRINSIESLGSSYEQLPPTDEPYYDMVAAEDEALTQSKQQSKERNKL